MALQEEMEKQGNWLFRYRSYLPLLVLAIGTWLYLKSQIYPELFILRNTPYEIYYEMLALLIGLLGLLVRVYTVGHTPRNTSGRNTKQGQVAESLNTTGIYSMVRHPLYLGNFLMWLAPALLTGHFWFIVAFCFLYWVYYERIMYAEEQFLRRKFGDQYLNWAEKIPAFLPKLKSFKPAEHPFSIRKVLRKEKNGLFALFLIFMVFDGAGAWIEGSNDYNYFLVVATLLTGLLYLVLKVLKKKTTFLKEPVR